jgi:hypothetical protein
VIYMDDADIERFWSKIETHGDDECWPWVAKSRNKFGYGMLSLPLREGKKRSYTASRISAFLAYGPPPEGKPHALHSCDNPVCCNPKHLRWGSPKENVKDAVDRNRASKPPRNSTYRNRSNQPKGDKVWNASLTETDVREIWRLHLDRQTVTQIAEAVGKPKHTVADIVRGRGWRHLEGAPSLEELKAGGVRRGYNQFSR